MKILLHTGLSKTGSTAIQNALVASRANLLAQGILYPELPGESDLAGHWQLGAFWRLTMSPKDEPALVNRFTKHGGETHAGEVIAAVHQHLALARAQGLDVLFSTEFLGPETSLDGMRDLRKLFETYTRDIRLLAYVRPPVDLFPSIVQQRLKRMANPPLGLFAEFPLRVRREADVFGESAMSVRIFSRSLLRDGDVVADFAGWLGEAVGRPVAPLLPGAFVNESLAAPACAVLVRLRRSLAGSDTGARIYSQTRKLLQQASADRQTVRLAVPGAWRARIESQAGRHWNDVLAMAAVDEPTRDRYRVQIAPGLAPISGGEIEAWLLSGYDAAFVRSFEAFCRSRPEPFAARVAEALKSIDRSDADET